MKLDTCSQISFYLKNFNKTSKASEVYLYNFFQLLPRKKDWPLKLRAHRVLKYLIHSPVLNNILLYVTKLKYSSYSYLPKQYIFVCYVTRDFKGPKYQIIGL